MERERERNNEEARGRENRKRLEQKWIERKSNEEREREKNLRRTESATSLDCPRPSVLEAIHLKCPLCILRTYLMIRVELLMMIPFMGSVKRGFSTLLFRIQWTWLTGGFELIRQSSITSSPSRTTLVLLSSVILLPFSPTLIPFPSLDDPLVDWPLSNWSEDEDFPALSLKPNSICGASKKGRKMLIRKNRLRVEEWEKVLVKESGRREAIKEREKVERKRKRKKKTLTKYGEIDIVGFTSSFGICRWTFVPSTNLTISSFNN